ncbi:MAG: DUF5716 family protein [Mobilitalea sp.]
MDAMKRLIVGFDLCEDYSQLCCYSYKMNEPITIGLLEQTEQEEMIPTALCVRKDSKQWLFGEEAVTCAGDGEGLLINQLITKLKTDEVTEIYQTKFSAVALLEKYLRKVLMLVKNYFPTEPITRLVITIEESDPKVIDKIYETLGLLGIDKDRANIISHASAYLYYVLSQEKNLWMNDVGLFDFSLTGLYFYRIRLNRRSNPMLASLEKLEFTNDLEEYPQLKNKEKASYQFDNLANTILHKQIISTLYFTGRGLESGWADTVIKSLCTGRRIFVGQSLYSKGACYAAKEFAGDSCLQEVRLFHDDMVTSSLGLRVFCDNKFKEHMLLHAGDTWYEVNSKCEVIPDGALELELVQSKILTKETSQIKLSLEPFPKPIERTTRWQVVLSCKDRSTATIKVTDLGFGEFYPGTGEVIEYTIEI